MNKTKVMLVAIILILFTQTIPVSAKQNRPTLVASGTIDSFVDVESAEIICGHWQVQVKNDEVIYKARYKELNLDEEIEESPVGSVDIFTHTLVTDSYEIDGDVLTFEGTMHVRKVWTKLDWTKEVLHWDSDVIIIVTPDEFFLDSLPFGPGPGIFDQDWDRVGMTTRFKLFRPIIKASGTIDSYVDAASVEIISGKWSVHVKGGELVYTARYKELNLDEEIEESPVGSVDIFTHTLTTDSYEIDGDVLTFEGTMHVKKVWTKLDWTKEVLHWDSDVIITVTPDEFFLNSYPHDPDPEGLDRIGTTKHFMLL